MDENVKLRGCIINVDDIREEARERERVGSAGTETWLTWSRRRNLCVVKGAL